MKDKKAKTAINGLIKIVNESNRKPNKLWVDQGKEPYNKPTQIWLGDHKGKLVVAERFIGTFKTKIYKRIIANSSKSYLGYLNKLVDEYNNTYDHSVGRKPVDVDYSALAEERETNPKSPKFKVGNKVRVAKYKIIFSKNYTGNLLTEIFVIDSVLKANLWTYKIKYLNGEKQ